MKKKRLLLVAGFLAACICLPLGVFAMMPDDRPGVTKANFDRIREGMTWAEVNAILGERDEEARCYDMCTGGLGCFWHHACWKRKDEATASITFCGRRNEEGSVFNKVWRDSTDTVFEKIRRWLHLP